MSRTKFDFDIPFGDPRTESREDICERINTVNPLSIANRGEALYEAQYPLLTKTWFKDTSGRPIIVLIRHLDTLANSVDFDASARTQSFWTSSVGPEENPIVYVLAVGEREVNHFVIIFSYNILPIYLINRAQYCREIFAKKIRRYWALSAIWEQKYIFLFKNGNA